MHVMGRKRFFKTPAERNNFHLNTDTVESRPVPVDNVSDNGQMPSQLWHILLAVYIHL